MIILSQSGNICTEWSKVARIAVSQSSLYCGKTTNSAVVAAYPDYGGVLLGTYPTEAEAMCAVDMMVTALIKGLPRFRFPDATRIAALKISPEELLNNLKYEDIAKEQTVSPEQLRIIKDHYGEE